VQIDKLAGGITTPLEKDCRIERPQIIFITVNAMAWQG
jgi:hypothetical protein